MPNIRCDNEIVCDKRLKTKQISR